MKTLGVNIDHIATLRNARGDFFPSMAYAANIAESAGADFITIHLREDRRHIKDEDVFLLKEQVMTYINLEMACNPDVLEQALKARPRKVTLVPEKREEVTTEGGLNIVDSLQFERVKEYTARLQDAGVEVSLFVEPDCNIIENCVKIGANDVEIHTGSYSLSYFDTPKHCNELLEQIKKFSKDALSAGLTVCAGHGLTSHNVGPIVGIDEITELNIGYSIIARSLFVGLERAVSEMKALIV